MKLAFTKHGLVAGLAAAVLTGTVSAQETAEAVFLDTNGKPIGTAKLMETPDGVVIRVEVNSLPPGEHAFHIHERGQCNPKDGFKSAGDHFSKPKQEHGYFSKGGPHAGDMPNQFVAKDGTLRAEVFISEVKLASASLLDSDGSALVLHVKPDDYRSQPSGNAGDRIACAVIKAGR